MAYVISSVPYFRCLVRREFTTNLARYAGEYIPAVAYGVRCMRGHSLWFQVMLMEPGEDRPNNTGGASFFLPLQALVHKPCPLPTDMVYVQPWDTFSSDFGVCEFDFVSRGACSVLPGKIPAQYRFTIDFIGSDLALDPDQHKSLHILFLESGLIGAFPNNRVLWHDDAFWKTMDAQPDFDSLNSEWRAEGNQHLFSPVLKVTDP
jgi:hypothetical protein